MAVSDTYVYGVTGLARYFGVSRPTVYRLMRNTSWLRECEAGVLGGRVAYSRSKLARIDKFLKKSNQTKKER